MEFGSFYMTRDVAEAMQEDPDFEVEVLTALSRYLSGDWGDLCRSDKKLNEEAIATGERVLAAYSSTKGKIYIIPEWDRSATTILFADEY